jgi:ferredoxin-NADP reductase
VILAGKIRENHNVTSYRFEGEGIGAFANRRAGQFLRLSVPDGPGWSEDHPFTLSNAPGEPALEITVKTVGAFTERLRGVEPGAAVRVRGPWGRFCADVDGRSPPVLLAGGIGITPFLSLLRGFRSAGAAPPVTLFWANNTEEDIFRREELSDLVGRLGLNLVHVLWKGDGDKLAFIRWTSRRKSNAGSSRRRS